MTGTVRHLLSRSFAALTAAVAMATPSTVADVGLAGSDAWVSAGRRVSVGGCRVQHT